MTDVLDRLPAEARWQIAARGLTGALVAFADAFKQAAGEAKCNEVAGELWYKAGKSMKDLIDSVGLPAGDAVEIVEVLTFTAGASMGPEFEYEPVEAGQERCVVRYTKCPWHERWKELGLDWDLCRIGHGRWGDGIIESVNSNYTHTLTKTMPGGAPYCELVVERKE